jgi:LPPG:FO 2-phospho-L-lactate transferase
MPGVVALAGGVGGAKLAFGLDRALAAHGVEQPENALTVVVNTGDDLELHGLHISPDLDTVMYTLAGLADPDRGWGLAHETWNALEQLERYGADTWFRLGDRDLATHIRRTERLRAGATLSEVTGEFADALEVRPTVLPMTDDDVRTKLRTADGWLDFQEWFVHRRQADRVTEVRFDGVDRARPAPGVSHAIATASLVVLCPSNPFVSIGPILAVPGILQSAPQWTCPGGQRHPDRRRPRAPRPGRPDARVARDRGQPRGRSSVVRGALPGVCSAASSSMNGTRR